MKADKLIKVTAPKDTVSSSNEHINEVLEKFEEQFKKEQENQLYYHLVITGEYPRHICDRVEKIYKKAGWKSVTCSTSSEKNERPGLTGLQLFTSD